MLKRRIIEGDKSKGVCENCEKLVNVTFKAAPLRFDTLEISNILQGFCDECACSVCIPHQESEKIKQFLKSGQIEKFISKEFDKKFNHVHMNTVGADGKS